MSEWRLWLDAIRLLFRDVCGVVAWPVVVLVVFLLLRQPLVERVSALVEVGFKDWVKMRFGERWWRQQVREDRTSRLSPADALVQSAWYVSDKICRYLLEVNGKSLTMDQHEQVLARQFDTPEQTGVARVPPWAQSWMERMGRDLRSLYCMGYLHCLSLEVPGIFDALKPDSGGRLRLSLPAEVEAIMTKRLEREQGR